MYVPILWLYLILLTQKIKHVVPFIKKLQKLIVSWISIARKYIRISGSRILHDLFYVKKKKKILLSYVENQR